jgi:serine/threonine protein kinase
MPLLDAGYQLGKYEIVRPLGKGGMGEIYVALDRRLSRTVAVKLLPAHVCHDQAAVERFRREARAASGLNHPHIVTIYDIGDCERGLYIAMELIEGQTLRDLAREKIPVQQLLVWGEQIARALAASHEAGVLHRDIKPENIMIRKDGYAKVLDFGLASLTSQPGDRFSAPCVICRRSTPVVSAVAPRPISSRSAS